ncbi:MAG TPA: hypothetical protein VKB19_10695 [Pedobacter sp.]|nr:hypothetical protein [Pedobacter sp.]
MENSDKPLQSSDGHNPGSRDDLHQQAEKLQADARAVAGFDSPDEDAADPEAATQGTSKGFDRDHQELETGLNDGDLDNDAE